MILIPRALLTPPIVSVCSGCCLFKCNVNDLRFESITVPISSEIKKEGSKRDLARLMFDSDTLKLRFSTEQNLPELQRKNDTYGSSIFLTLCNDVSQIVSIEDVITEKSRRFDNIFNADLPGAGNQLTSAPNVRITYETAVRIKDVRHEV